jgi:Tol biopolymer transport system component
MTNWLYPQLSDRASHIYLLDQQGYEVALIDKGLDGSPGTCSREPDCIGDDAAMVADDGRVVAFSSPDSDLVPGDGNNALDVFVWRRADNSIKLISTGPNGQGSLDSHLESMSGDGRFIAFSSSSPNLAQNDANGHPDVFLRDTLLETTKLVSVGLDGQSANGSSGNASVSRDGRYVAFISDASDIVAGLSPVASQTTQQRRLYVRDLATQGTYAITAPAGDLVSYALLSADGRTIAYVVDAATDTKGAQAKVMVARARP